ncbi:exopolyphosphatase [Cryptococcus deuterogattii R265]|uniref:exopolyphosphatase n=1 Tax=Cryptococcus deuterogattii (strain R265) TaxID=294750 RepID=UPI001935D07F|nr:exopolyphosphatase [Cryptococcus deuterogattii R265]
MDNTAIQSENGDAAVAEGRLAGFLSSQKDLFLQDLKDGKGKGWTVVMGNQAGDLDSLASSVAFSQLSATLLASRVVPLILTPPKSMSLRPENLVVLKNTSIPLTSLLYASQLPVSTTALASQGVTFALVDHNKLLPQFGQGKVDAIIDHHEDENAHTDASIREITIPTGSCASLVVKHFQPQWEASVSRGSPVPPELATLLLSAIVIDTGGLKPGGKATPVDYDAAAFLYSISTVAAQGGEAGSFSVTSETGRLPPSLKVLADTLQEAKSNVSSLTTYELLMRDYKEYEWPTQSRHFPTLKVGLSTVPLGLKPWIAKESEGWETLMNDTEQYMQEGTLDIEGILTTYRSEKKGKHKRQLAIIVRPGGVIRDTQEARSVFDRLVAGLEASEELQLGEWNKEEKIKRGDDQRLVKVWVQGNAKATRKQVAPLLKNLVSQLP